VYPLAKAVRASQFMKVRDDWGLQMGYTAGQMDQKRIERTESLAFTLRFPVVLIGSPLCVIASPT